MGSRLVEIDIDDYIEMLECRRQEIAAYYDLTIPDGVWEYYLKLLEDRDAKKCINPSFLVNHIAMDGNYGPIENYGIFEDMVQELIHINEDCLDEDEAGLSHEEATRLLSMFSYCDILWLFASIGGERDVFFTYVEPDSDYGFGVCYSL